MRHKNASSSFKYGWISDFENSAGSFDQGLSFCAKRGPHLPHWQVSKIPTFVRNSFFYLDKFLSNVWKLVRSHHRQRNGIHYDALQFPEITNLTSVQLILTNVRMKYLSRHIFSLKQQLVRQNRLRRFDSDKCQWGRCMAQNELLRQMSLHDKENGQILRGSLGLSDG